MKLAAVTPVYNEENLITGCIKCLEDFVDEHIVLVSEKPYYGEPDPLDKTAGIAESLGAGVIMGEWSLDHHQRNTGISLLEDYDWIICTDVDMWITRDDMESLVDRLRNSKAEAHIIRQLSYWKDTDHILEDDDFMPVIAIRPHVRFVHIGNIGSPFERIEDIHIHHINWCEPKDILKKVKTYPHSVEFDGELWYKYNYEGWNGGDAVLPTGKMKVKKQSLPEELQKYLRG